MPPVLVFRADSGLPGPSLLVFGAIHGDETCGPAALSRLAEELSAGTVRLTRGTLALVPVCNPRAYESGARFVDKNLNRVFRPHAAPSCYEEGLADELAPLVARHDFLLDLHSLSSGDAPFVFRDYADAATVAFAGALGVADVVTGWPEMYSETADVDTGAYARSLGKVGVTVECGRHGSAESAQVAYRAVRAAMAHLGLAEGERLLPAAVRVIRAETIFRKERPGEFVRAWKNFDAVRAGETVGRYADGSELKAPADGLVILPYAGARPGDEWFYFGVPEQLSA